MSLRVIGAGLGRTGTNSLQVALQMLLDAPCYHMLEVFERPDDVPVWHRAAHGEMPDWKAFLGDYRAAVDWPASAYWEELAAAFPDAVILLSTRDADGWWKSASDTIFPACLGSEPGLWREMVFAMFENRFTARIDDRATAIAAYHAHNAHVRATAPAARLVEWQPGDGWEPLCAALELPVPEQPFPHVNTTAEFKDRMERRNEGGDA